MCSHEYTQYTIFNIKKKVTLNNPVYYTISLYPHIGIVLKINALYIVYIKL